MKIKTAKKQHRCDNCACKILKGEVYQSDKIYQKASYDSEFDISTQGKIYYWHQHIDNDACDSAISREIGDMFT